MRKRYTINFTKALQFTGYMSWKEVTDAYILQVISRLQKKYQFRIVNIEIRSAGCGGSSVTIRCKRRDFELIFFEFCNALSGKIEEVSIEKKKI